MSEIVYVATRTLSRFHRDNRPIRYVMGPVRSGKTVAGLMEMLMRAHAQEPDADGIRATRGAIVRNTYRKLKDSTLKTCWQWIRLWNESTLKGDGYWSEDNMTFHYGLSGSLARGGRYIREAKDPVTGKPDGTFVYCEMMFRAMDRPDQVENLTSTEYTFAWFNEFRDIPREIVNEMNRRVGQFPEKKRVKLTWSGIWLEGNPPAETSEYYPLLTHVNPDDPTIAFYHQPPGLLPDNKDNPDADNRENLQDPNYYQNEYVKSVANGESESYRDQQLRGMWGFHTDGKPVYGHQFDEARHVSVKPLIVEPATGIGVGLDVGVNHAAMVIGQCGLFGNWRIFDEFEFQDVGSDTYAEILRRHMISEYRLQPPQVTVYYDPFGNSRAQTDLKTVVDSFTRLKFKTFSSVKEHAGRFAGVRAVLGRHGGFAMNRRCRSLFRAMIGGYRFKGEKPDKNDSSHIAESLEYLLAPFEGHGRRRWPMMEDAHWPNVPKPDAASGLHWDARA